MGQAWCWLHKKTKAFLWTTVVETLTVAVVFGLAGCTAVGPDYEEPASSAPGAWHTELSPGLAATALGGKELTEWWAISNDPLLTDLIAQAVSTNLDLRQAQAKVREARARRGISQAGQFPSIDASGSTSRSKGSESTGGGATRNAFAMGFDAGWEVDIFGGVRRAVEAADADIGASQEALHGVLVTLTAEVALNYLDTRTLQARLAVAEANLALQQQTLELTEARFQAGLVNELALQQARYNLENSRAQIPGLRSSLEGAKNRLAVLTGRIPGSVHELLAQTAAIPSVPLMVAVGIPAETLRQRPDIRRAERQLAAQTARIGVASADLYPKFRLLGSIGLESLKSAELFKAASETWRLGPSVSWNIFDAGAIRQNIEVQSAIQEQYLFAYEAAVLAALEEVENGLTAYGEEQLRRARLVAAVAAARQAHGLAINQYEAGLVDFTTVLEAQRSLLSFEDQLVSSDGTVTANLIRLYKALGGGWVVPETPELPEKRMIDHEQP
ncbi:MAG: efflux transporter outer membrane subunit [Proteobacteria bacterium]|nr:efflux transporter outer membrane subunit [Pseudomonadota bacterium]MBU1641329.1 efflux transporter outer membrane subunit [Pseudomonadota bacterium]